MLSTNTPLLCIPASGYFSIQNAREPENILREALIISIFFVILIKVGEAGGSQMVRSAAVLQPYQHLSVGFSQQNLLSQSPLPRQGLLSNMRNHIHKPHSFQENSDCKPNLKGYGCEGPYPISVPGLHASTAVPCHSLS